MEFDYTITTTKKFNDAVEAVQQETAKAGMLVLHVHDIQEKLARSEERRVGKECRSRWSPYH